MTTVPVDPQFSRMLQPNFLCRNGQVVGQHTENAMRRHTNQIMAYRGKTFFVSPGELGSIPASAGALRARFRFRGYTSITAKRLVVHVIMAPENAVTPDSPDSYVLFTETISGGTLEFHYSGATGSDVPSDLTYMTASLDIDAGTDIACEFYDVHEARLVSALVYEELADPDTANGLMMPISAGVNVLDAHRQQLATNLKNIWETQGSQIWNWTADTSAAAFTNSTTTAKNLIDSSVTTVSAASPGATVDLTGKATRRQESTGVPVKIWVYASAATSTGAVRIVNSSGSTIYSIPISVAAAAWYSTTGVLPASSAKYDLHGVAGAAGTVTVYAVSIYEFGIGTGPVSSWTTDATSSKGTPISSTEWTSLMTSAGLATGNPSDLYLMQEASGNAADSIGTKTLTASGTLAYQQTVSGWTRKSIKTTAGSAGKLINTTFANVNANSILVLLYAQVPTPGTERTIMRVGDVFDADAALDIVSTPRIKAKSATNTATGANDYTGAVRPYIIRVNQTTDVVTIITDQEKITPTFSASMAGTELCFGGDNSQTWFPDSVDYLYAAVFTGSAAELTDAQVKTLLQTLGWTIPWT